MLNTGGYQRSCFVFFETCSDRLSSLRCEWRLYSHQVSCLPKPGSHAAYSGLGGPDRLATLALRRPLAAQTMAHSSRSMVIERCGGDGSLWSPRCTLHHAVAAAMIGGG